jgi:site-specific DNA recombinase
VKPEADQVAVQVDPIIDAATFDAVQAMLTAKNPKAMPPRVVTGPILLTGIATCASCGGGMMLRTDKSADIGIIPARPVRSRARAPARAVRSQWTSLTRSISERLAEKLLTLSA